MRKIILLLMLILLNFACAGEEKKQLPSSKVAYLLHRVEISSIELQKSLDSLKQAKQLHTVPKIKETIRRIEVAEKTLAASKRDVDLFMTFLKTNERKLSDDNEAYYLDLKPLMGKHLDLDRKYAANYLGEFKVWQQYSLDNFDQIKKRDLSRTRKYDALMIKYEKALKKFNTAQRKDTKFINNYLAASPELVKKFQKDYKLMKSELGWK